MSDKKTVSAPDDLLVPAMGAVSTAPLMVQPLVSPLQCAKW